MFDSVAESNRGLAFQGLAWKPGPAVNHPGVASGVAADSSLWRIPLISPPALLIFALGDLTYSWWIWKALIMRDIRI